MHRKKEYTHFFERIAEANHTTVSEVRHEMEAAIRAAYENPNPAVRAQWVKISRTGDMPTPDELIAYLVREIKKA